MVDYSYKFERNRSEYLNSNIETDDKDIEFLKKYYNIADNHIKFFSFEVDEKMSSKSNYRQDGIKNWKKIKEFEDYVSLICKLKRSKDFLNIYENKNVRYAIIIESTSKIDVGNYSKSILDSLEGVIYNNDKEVDLLISRRIKKTDRKEKTLIHIFKILY